GRATKVHPEGCSLFNWRHMTPDPESQHRRRNYCVDRDELIHPGNIELPPEKGSDQTQHSDTEAAHHSGLRYLVHAYPLFFSRMPGRALPASSARITFRYSSLSSHARRYASTSLTV